MLPLWVIIAGFTMMCLAFANLFIGCTIAEARF